MGEFIVHQSDERMFFLKAMLERKSAPTVVHVFAPNIVISAKILEDVAEKCVIVGGRADSEASVIMDSLGIKHCNMLENEVFQATNARLTAEGTLSVVIEHSMISIAETKVLVIGFGRTGSAVIRLFDRLGMAIDIATTASIRPAHAFAQNVLPMHDFDFSSYDTIVNTVPAAIVSENEILTMKQGAVYIDLASNPAINLEYAKYLGVDANIYPALPAKTSPISAATAIENYILGVIQ